MANQAKKVLIADDEPDVHEFVKAVLRDCGVTILSAEDGEAAIATARAETPDLVILDIQMPKKDGFQVFQELRGDDATKGIPVIMLTAVSARTGIKFGSETVGEYFGSEPEKYIDKPIDPQTLKNAVLQLIAGQE